MTEYRTHSHDYNMSGQNYQSISWTERVLTDAELDWVERMAKAPLGSGEKTTVVIVRGGQSVAIECDTAGFPSEQLITQLRMLG